MPSRQTLLTNIIFTACILASSVDARTVTAAEAEQVCKGGLANNEREECVRKITTTPLRSYDLAIDISGVTHSMMLEDFGPPASVSGNGVTLTVRAAPSPKEAELSLLLKIADESDTDGKPKWYNHTSRVLLRPNETIVLTTTSGKRVSVNVRVSGS